MGAAVAAAAEPPSGPQYHQLEYWENRYATAGAPYDWFQGWEGLKDALVEFMKPQDHFLILGCGNSPFSEAMYKAGFQDQTNIDFSTRVIQDMREKFRDSSFGMTFQEMDVLKMENIPTESIDVVLDKAMLDTILTGEDPDGNSHQALTHVSRVLKSSGIYISVSHRPPSARKELLEVADFRWQLQVRTVPRPGVQGAPKFATHTAQDGVAEPTDVHWVYICTKASQAA